MLRLHRLELCGFKSFVDPVTLDVAGGLTAIVGPNGCGKSNIADAVIWVLGERSAKSLRGERMEDVIFAGAKNRKPLGMAEVTLELTSDNGFEASEDGHLTIGRRLHRSGESEYYLNGKKVRMKDIRDLLMDTGLGLRAYSMIEQGKIGMILSGKPQERRRLLEEAAGITRYRERRRLAEFKLEEAKANLARLDDILSEVERAVRSLKRQANAARRYKGREEEHRELLRRTLEGRWAELQGRLSDFKARCDDLVAQEAEVSATLHRQEAELTGKREELEGLSRGLAERHRRAAELAATIEGKQEFLKGSRQRLKETGERIAAGWATAEERRRRIGELEESLRRQKEHHQDLLGERDRAASEVSEDDVRISQFEKLVAEASSRLESLRGRLLSSISDLTGLRNRLHREQVESEKGELQRHHLIEELGQKRRDLREAEESLSAAAGNLAELEGRCSRIEQQLDRRTLKLDELILQQETLVQEQADLEARLADLRQRHALLTELGEEHEERRRALERLLQEAGLERLEFLADRLKVPPGWERSLDLFLGGVEDAVVLPPDRDALELARALAGGRGTGRLLKPSEGSDEEREHLDDPAIRASLGEALELPAAVAAALPPAYLVDTPADAERLARHHPGVAFISRERLWAQSGILHVQGAEARPGLLAREQELARLSQKISPLAERLEGLAGELEGLVERQRVGRDRIRQAEQELAERRQELAVARARHDDLTTRQRRLAVEAQTLDTERDELGRHLGLAAERSAQLGQEVERSEQLHADLETAFDQAQAELERARQERESTRTTGASRRGRLELLQERLDAHDQETARLRREMEEAEHRIALWQEESKKLEGRQREIEAAMEQADLELQEALERRAASQEEVVAEQERLDEMRADIQASEERVEATRAERDRLRSEISEVRVGEAGLKQEAEHLRGSFEEEFREELPERPGKPPAELEELQADLARRKQILERMGPVNLLAAQEYEEQVERHRFLSEQRADVGASVERLEQTIREINETSSERFRATFEEVNRHFRSTFVELFRGGEAEMRLLDESDVLETVIEIVARPPGKRLQNLMLLSGGEKALAAIALLFALFRTKPSPFCILDEVDAPLDDVNTLRFVELVKKMSQETQFIIITHNKLTMEAAAMLYGVTMQERGVSNLVSVELEAVQPGEPAEAATA